MKEIRLQLQRVLMTIQITDLMQLFSASNFVLTSHCQFYYIYFTFPLFYLVSIKGIQSVYLSKQHN